MPNLPVVTFNWAKWSARYPEFAGIGEPLAQFYFDEAGTYCANDSCNPAWSITVYDGGVAAPLLGRLLNMLAAHIAWLNAPRGPDGNPSNAGQPPSPIVGRITSASEGSVSVSTENSYEPGTPQWYQQTRYGSAYWAASAPLRTARYAANPTIVAGGAISPYAYGLPRRRRW